MQLRICDKRVHRCQPPSSLLLFSESKSLFFLLRSAAPPSFPSGVFTYLRIDRPFAPPPPVGGSSEVGRSAPLSPFRSFSPLSSQSGHGEISMPPRPNDVTRPSLSSFSCEKWCHWLHVDDVFQPWLVTTRRPEKSVQSTANDGPCQSFQMATGRRSYVRRGNKNIGNPFVLHISYMFQPMLALSMKWRQLLLCSVGLGLEELSKKWQENLWYFTVFIYLKVWMWLI